ncbi:hypothetical protein BKA82DRAFT_4355089 [Pisolithus tinctorius]|nr:hypothetical protein BKA82DRAFT_4355089 [Pisolithus tinctorius]
MSLAKLKVAFKGKSMAKCNLGATPPAPMMGRPAAQSSQKIRQTVALVPSTSTPGVQGQGAPVGDREDIGPAPVNRRKFLRLQASMKTLRSLFPQRRQNEGEEQAVLCEAANNSNARGGSGGNTDDELMNEVKAEVVDLTNDTALDNDDWAVDTSTEAVKACFGTLEGQMGRLSPPQR